MSIICRNQQILINQDTPYLRHVSIDSYKLKKTQNNILLVRTDPTVRLMIKLCLYSNHTYIYLYRNKVDLLVNVKHTIYSSPSLYSIKGKKLVLNL